MKWIRGRNRPLFDRPGRPVPGFLLHRLPAPVLKMSWPGLPAWCLLRPACACLEWPVFQVKRSESRKAREFTWKFVCFHPKSIVSCRVWYVSTGKSFADFPDRSFHGKVSMNVGNYLFFLFSIEFCSVSSSRAVDQHCRDGQGEKIRTRIYQKRFFRSYGFDWEWMANSKIDQVERMVRRISCLSPTSL